MKILFISFLLFLAYSCKPSYTHSKYIVDGTYNGKGAQGMSIHKNIAFLFNDGGHFRVYDLKKSIVLKECDLASSSKTCHVNNACFSYEFLNNNSLPLLYITEYLGERRCFVECIDDNYNTVLLQTISFKRNGKPVFVWNWCVDAEDKCLYALHNVSMDKKNKNVVNKVVKFKLPNLTDGKNIVLTENDILDAYEVNFANGVQGGKIRKGYWYISAGLHENNKDKFDSERAIIVIDLKKRKIDRIIDLTSITTDEPEDIDFYKGEILLYCGQAGGLYFVKDK